MQDDTASPDWAAVRADYETGNASVASLCRKWRLHRGQLYRRIASESWTMRRPREEVTTLVLTHRLRRLAERELASLELARDAQDSPASPADSERAAKALAGLVKVIENIAALEQRLAQAAAPAGNGHAAIDDDALRAELARRLEKMRRDAAGPLSEPA